MADSLAYLTDAHLRGIEDSLDLLVMPSPEEIRALVAETRRLRAANDTAARYARALASIDSIIHHTTQETT